MSREQDAHNRRMFKLGIASLVVSVMIALGNLGYQFLHDHSSSKTNEKRFSNIETSLRLLTATVAPQLQKAVDDSLQSALKSGGQQNDAKKQLAFARDAIGQLNQASAPMTKETAAFTASRINDVTSAYKGLPETWQAAAEFITYRSRISVDEQGNLPSCLLQGVTRRTTTPALPGKNVTVGVGPVEYHNCGITIDSPEGRLLLSQALSWGNIIFEHCVIIYTGGSLVLTPVQIISNVPAHFLGSQIEFKECSFHFSLQAVPPPAGQKLTENLLTATTDSITVDTNSLG
jgi:hypothetical protein